MPTPTRESAVTTKPNGNGNGSSVRVEIYDQAYNLRGTDPDYIFKLAEYVDTKMRSVAEQTSTVDSLRLAVLAALNIADEYQVLKRKYDAIAGSYSARASELSNLLSDALEEGRRVS
jgi:cell division protein ZapA